MSARGPVPGDREGMACWCLGTGHLTCPSPREFTPAERVDPRAAQGPDDGTNVGTGVEGQVSTPEDQGSLRQRQGWLQMTEEKRVWRPVNGVSFS